MLAALLSRIELSSLEWRRDASKMCGDGDSLPGVPPPSESERVLVMGDFMCRSMPAASGPSTSPLTASISSVTAMSSK